jgi:hypothetical protein
MLTDSREELVVEAAAGVNPEYLKARMRLDESISGQVVRTGKLTIFVTPMRSQIFLFLMMWFAAFW